MSSKSSNKDSPLSLKNLEPTHLEDCKKLIRSLRTELESQNKIIQQLRREKTVELKSLQERETTKFNILLKDQRTKLHHEKQKELESQREALTKKFEGDTSKALKLKDTEIAKSRNDLKRCQDDLLEMAQCGLSATARGSFVREQTRLESKINELQGTKRTLEDDLKKTKETVKTLSSELLEEQDTHKLELQRLTHNHDQEVRKLLDELKTKTKMIVNKDKEMSSNIGLLEKMKFEKEVLNDLSIKNKQFKDEEVELKKHQTTKEGKERNQMMNEKKEVAEMNKTLEARIKALIEEKEHLQCELNKSKNEYRKVISDLDDKLLEMKTTEIFTERIEELKQMNFEQEVTIDALQKSCAEKDRRMEIVSYNHRKARVKNKSPKKTVRFLLPAKLHMVAAGIKETYYQEDVETDDNVDTAMPSSPSFNDEEQELENIFDFQDINEQEVDEAIRVLYKRLSWEHLKLERSHAVLQESTLSSQIEAQHNQELCCHLEANLAFSHERINELENMLESSVSDMELDEITKPDEISNLNRQISELLDINEELEFRSLELQESTNKIIKDMQDNELDLQKKVEELNTSIDDSAKQMEILKADHEKKLVEGSVHYNDGPIDQASAEEDLQNSNWTLIQLEQKVQELQKTEAVNKYMMEFNKKTEERYREEIDSLKRKLESALQGKDYEQSVISDTIRQLTMNKRVDSPTLVSDQADCHLLKSTEMQTEEYTQLSERLQVELNISNTDIITKNEIIESQKSHIQMMQIEMEELLIANKFIQSNVEKKTEEITTLKAKFTAVEGENRCRKGLHDDLLKNFTDLTNEKEELKEKYMVLEEQVQNHKDSQFTQKVFYEALKEELKIKESQLETCLKDVKVLEECKKQFTSMKKEITLLNDELNKLDNLKSEMIVKSHELKELQCKLIDYDSIQNQLRLKTAECHRLRSKSRDFQVVQEQLDIKCEEIFKLENEMQKLTSMEKNISRLKEEIVNLRHDKKHVESNLIEVENMLINLKQENATLKERLQDLSFANENEKLQLLRESEEKLREKVKVLEGSLYHRKSESEDSDEKIMSLEMKITILQRLEDEARKSCKEKDTSIEYLKEKVKELENLKNELHEYYLLRIECFEKNRSVKSLPVFEDVDLDKSWDGDSKTESNIGDERLLAHHFESEHLVKKVKSLEDEVSEHEKTISKLQEEAARLRTENIKLNAVSDERNSYYSILSELNLLIYDKDELNEQIHKMKIIHEKAVSDHDGLDTNSELILKYRIDELSNQEIQLKHQITDLEYELKEMHSNFKEEKALNDELNEKIRQIQLSENNLRKKLAQFEFNGTNLVDKHDELLERTTDLEFSLQIARRNEKDAKLKMLQLEDRENEMVENFESIIDTYEASEQKLKGRLSDAAEDKKTLLDTVDQLTYRISELEYLETMLNQKIKHAENNESGLQNRLQRLESEENSGQLRVIELENQKEAAMMRIHSLEEEKSNLSNEISDLELAKNDFMDNMSISDDSYKFFKEKVESQVNVIQTYELRIEGLTEKEVLLETQIKEFIAQEEELDRKIVQLEKENAALMGVIKETASKNVQARLSETFTIKQVMPELRQAMKDLESQNSEAYIKFSRTLYSGHLSKEEERLFNNSMKSTQKQDSDDEECVSEETIEPVEKARDPFGFLSVTSEDPLWQAIESGSHPSTEISFEEKYWANIENRSDGTEDMTISIPMNEESNRPHSALSNYSADEASEIHKDEGVVSYAAPMLSMEPEHSINKVYSQLIEEENLSHMATSSDSGLGTIDHSFKEDLEDKISLLEKQLEIQRSTSTLITKEELEELEDELASVKIENRRLVEEIENLEGAQQKSVALESQVSELIEEIDQLHDLNKEKSEQLDTIQNEYFELNGKCQELIEGEEEKDELEHTVVQLRNQLSENESYTIELSQQLEKVISLEDKVAEMMKNENELLKENSQLKEQIENLNKQLVHLRKEDVSRKRNQHFEKSSKSMTDISTVSIQSVNQLKVGPAMLKCHTEMDYFDQQFHRQHISLEKGSIVNIIGEAVDDDYLQIEVGGKIGQVQVQSLQTPSLSPDVKMAKRQRPCSAEFEGVPKTHSKSNICSITHPAFRRSYIPMGTYATYPRKPSKSDSHVNVSHSSSYSTISENKRASFVNNVAHTIKHAAQLHNTELLNHQPEPPENFRIERVVAKELILLSWELPQLDKYDSSNGVQVEGYKISIDGLDEFYVTDPNLTKALIENIDISHPLTFSIQTMGKGSTLSISVDIYHNGSIREGAIKHKDDSLVLSGLPHHDTDCKLFLAIYDYDPNSQSSRNSYVGDYDKSISSRISYTNDELSLKTGDIVVTFGEERGDGFYWGKVSGRQGLVPRYFLEEIAMPRPNTSLPNISSVFL